MQKLRILFRSNRMAHSLVLTGLLACLYVTTTMAAQAAPQTQTASEGEAIFNAKCAACHTIGGGKLIGPDLKGITLKRDTAWLANWIKAPDKVLASGDPIAAQLLADNNHVPMPNLGLSDSDVAALIAYFESVDRPAASIPTQAAGTSLPAAQPTAAQPQPLTGVAEVLELNGDPDAGRQLFVGAEGLQNGGIPCNACHTVDGIGLVGGGSIGPNLTHVYTRYGHKGLAPALVNIPFPTMQGAFAGKPLTASEQADLLAFFESADSGGKPGNGRNFGVILGAGVLLMVMLFLGMLYFWPSQRMSIAQRLRKNGKL